MRQRVPRGQALRQAVRLVGDTELAGTVTKPWGCHLPDSRLSLGGACGFPETCLPLSQAWRKSKGSRCPYCTGGEGRGDLPGSTPGPTLLASLPC